MMISVILPSYNYAEELPRCIESVLTQTISDWELIIVDDGSSDNSVEVIKAYVQKYPERIRFYQHEGAQNKGLSRTYQLGISKAKGEYIAFLEADDYWREDSLALKADVLDRYPDVSVSYTDVEMFGDEKIIRQILNDIQKWKLGNKITAGTPYDAFGYLLDQNHTLTCSAMMTRKKLLAEVNFMSPCDAWFDWWVLAQLSLEGMFYKCPQKATFWQLRARSYLREFSKTINVRKESRIFLNRLFRLMKNHLRLLPSPKRYPERELLANEIKKRRLRKTLFDIEVILPLPLYKIWDISVKILSKIIFVLAIITIPVRWPLRFLWRSVTRKAKEESAFY